MLAEGERTERMRQLFGKDFQDATDKELGRVSPMQQLNEKPRRAEQSSDVDELAGRRVREQMSSTDLEQLFNVGARFDGLWTLIDGARKGSLGSSAIVPGVICIARRDFPSKYIVVDQAYEVREIYYQGLNGSEVERLLVTSLDAKPPEGCSGYVMYMKIFSEAYHTEPVIVRPEEVGLVSLGEEVVDSLKIAIPILGFWLTVISFLLAYGQQGASAATDDAVMESGMDTSVGILLADLEPPRMGDFSGSPTDVMYNNFALEGAFLLLIALALVSVALGDPKRE